MSELTQEFNTPWEITAFLFVAVGSEIVSARLSELLCTDLVISGERLYVPTYCLYLLYVSSPVGGAIATPLYFLSSV